MKIRCVLLVLAASLAPLVAPPAAEAHRDGCHRWHSCPSDTGSYTCGDLGYTDQCPGATAAVAPPSDPAAVAPADDTGVLLSSASVTTPTPVAAPAPVASGPSPAPLARTGRPSSTVVGLGLSVVLFGSLLAFMGRRRVRPQRGDILAVSRWTR